MSRYHSLCDDFYVNLNLNTEMELPSNRETVLHFFEQIQRSYPMMANFLIMGMLLPFVYRPMPIESLGLVALMALLAFIAGLCLIAAYKRSDAAIIAPMQYSQIIWAAVYGMFFFGETVDRATWAGAAIIITSGLYIVLRETFGGKSVVNPVSLSRMRPETGTSPRSGVLWWKVRKAKDEG